MRRRRGGGGIFGVITTLILLGVGMAILRQFDWDIGAAVTWLGDQALHFINGVSDWVSSQPFFQSLFKS